MLTSTFILSSSSSIITKVNWNALNGVLVIKSTVASTVGASNSISMYPFDKNVFGTLILQNNSELL